MPIRYETEQIRLWSPFRRKLLECKQTTAVGSQWAGLVRNFEKSGVSATEIAWSGILEYLQERTGCRVSREDLIEFLDGTARCELQLIRQINDDFEPSVRFHRVVRPSKPPQIEVKNGRRERRIVDYRRLLLGLFISDFDPSNQVGLVGMPLADDPAVDEIAQKHGLDGLREQPSSLGSGDACGCRFGVEKIVCRLLKWRAALPLRIDCKRDDSRRPMALVVSGNYVPQGKDALPAGGLDRDAKGIRRNVPRGSQPSLNSGVV